VRDAEREIDSFTEKLNRSASKRTIKRSLSVRIYGDKENTCNREKCAATSARSKSSERASDRYRRTTNRAGERETGGSESAPGCFHSQEVHEPSLQFLDLIQEGNIGLMKAVDKLSGGRGYKFFRLMQPGGFGRPITARSPTRARTIRIPVHMIETNQQTVFTRRARWYRIDTSRPAKRFASRWTSRFEGTQVLKDCGRNPFRLNTDRRKKKTRILATSSKTSRF